MEDFKKIALKYAETLRLAAVENGITQREISQKTGTSEPGVNRSLTGKYVMRLDLFLNYCDAIGIKVTLTNIKNQTNEWQEGNSIEVQPYTRKDRKTNKGRDHIGYEYDTPINNTISHKWLTIEQITRVRDFAKEKGISHETIAEKMGITRQGVTKILAGKNLPRLDTFFNLCDAVGVPLPKVLEKGAKESDR